MDIFSKTTINPSETDGTYDVTLSRSLTGAIAMIVLDFYRSRPVLQFATGLVGIPLVLGGAWATLTIDFDWWDFAAYGALLTGAAVFSSKRFNVSMSREDDDAPNEEHPKERTPAEGGYTPLEVAIKETLDGQTRSQQEARGRFRWGLLCLLLGASMSGTSMLLLLSAGGAASWRPYFWGSVGLGCVLVAGVLLHSSRTANKTSTHFHSQLSRLRELEVAISLAQNQPTEDAKARAADRIIDILLRSMPEDAPELNSGLVLQPAGAVTEL